MKRVRPTSPPSFALPRLDQTAGFAPGAPSEEKRGTLRRLRDEQRKESGFIHLSVLIPIYNERENLPGLVRRLQRALTHMPYRVECIFIDDHSTDGSVEYLSSLQSLVPLRVLLKEGKRGKSASLRQGAAAARGSIIAMIDADLQYPPEAIPEMVRKIGKVDIVVARRTHRRTSFLRTFLSGTFNAVFGRFLLSLDIDVQSGLKVFRKDALSFVRFTDSPWSFDYQFLFQAKRMGWTIGEVPIVFEERFRGTSNVRAVSTGLELAWGAVRLRLSSILHRLFPFLAATHPSEYFFEGYENDADYLFIPEIHSVKRQITWENVSLSLIVLGTLGAGIAAISWLLRVPPLLVVSASIALLYLGLIFFKLRMVIIANRHRPISIAPETVSALANDELPFYTILVPLYQEAEVIPQIVAAMSSIDYPTDRLEIIITLEEYDEETRQAIEEANPPPHVRVLTLPNVKPKTKPKALNVAFREARGEYLVIYDAEIIPDPDQLKKAVLAFREHPEISCLQTRLDHYNADRNWITKLFNAEFTFYYDLFLPGLQEQGYPLPLSGHSTHFRKSALRDIGAWDPYNVTEDCDVGMRLYRAGHRSALLDSFSQEESTDTFGAWARQRSRWVKGFIQTSAVHLRHPLRLKRELGGWKPFLAFLIIVPGSVFVNALNLIYWILLLAWVATGARFIQDLFPGIILYSSLGSFLVGNFLFTYFNLLGAYRRKRYAHVKYSLLSPVYWIMLAYATIRGAFQMVFKPHHWEKTRHGTHLASKTYAIPLARELATVG